MKDREEGVGVREAGQDHELPADELKRRAEAFFGLSNDGGENSEVVVKPEQPLVPVERVIVEGGKRYVVRDAAYDPRLAAADKIENPGARRRLYDQRKRQNP